jgi:Peptidase family M23
VSRSAKTLPSTGIARIARISLIASISLAGASAFAQVEYPAVRALRESDLIFAQLADSIERYHQSEMSGKGDRAEAEPSFYAYTMPGDADVFSVAAAFSLPYDTLVTLNRLDSLDVVHAGTTLLVPSIPGIFVCESPGNELEYLVRSLWAGEQRAHFPVRAIVGGHSVDYIFYPGAEFHASERTFFLVAGFRFPLPKGVITSGFGQRLDPFTGRSERFHTGIDIGAPFGTRVFASRAGKIESTGYSETYGNFIIIAHDANWETLYGHLSKILAAKGQAVSGGDVIGLVGSTGMSTGPHLHFETRKRGEAIDPAPLLGSRRSDPE